MSSNIVYKATITCDKPNYDAKIYLGISEGKFKTRYANHKKSFCHDKYRTETELSIEYWKLRDQNYTPSIKFEIKKKCSPYQPSSDICNLCISEKLLILEHPLVNILNQRKELVSKCRHKNKFKLCNHKLKTWRNLLIPLHCIII